MPDYILNGCEVIYVGDDEGHPGYAFEAFAREEYDVESTTTHDNDGIDADGEPVEMKVAKLDTGRDPGRIILKCTQHHRLLFNDRDYIIGVHTPLSGSAPRWKVKDHVRIPARVLHEACGLDERTWTWHSRDDGSYWEMGVRWPDVPTLGCLLSDKMTNPASEIFDLIDAEKAVYG